MFPCLRSVPHLHQNLPGHTFSFGGTALVHVWHLKVFGGKMAFVFSDENLNAS